MKAFPALMIRRFSSCWAYNAKNDSLIGFGWEVIFSCRLRFEVDNRTVEHFTGIRVECGVMLNGVNT